jgi:hypothetical protein
VRQSWRCALIAADRGNTNVLRLLLDAGADPNTLWPGGWTPLVRAAFAGSHGAVALLLDRGADPWVQMTVDNPQSVAGLMRQFWPERVEIIRLLERAENADRSNH